MTQKIQIILKSLDRKSLYFYNQILKKNFLYLNIKASFVILPKKKKKITLLKSPHVNKKAQEHFQLTRYKTVITCKTITNISVFNTIFINKPKHIFFQVKILRE